MLPRQAATAGISFGARHPAPPPPHLAIPPQIAPFITVPFFEHTDRLFLGQISVDIKTSTSVPTNDFINMMVDAVAKIRVMNTQEGIRLAAKNFLNMSEKEYTF
ncbi:MAG: hypothetical protein MJZ57_06545 [Bacteroidales bacterium]|nr:hypothetical protein [Bacteroidales bacterium]